MNPFSDGFGDGPDRAVIAFFVVFVSIFVLIFGVILFGLVRGLVRWNRNNNSPLVTVPAVVVAKRGDFHRGTDDAASSTSYYVTFEVQGGQRQEMLLRGSDYGLLVEGDRGRLTTQGSRYKGFARTPQDR